MRSILFALFVLLAVQAISEVTARKVKKTKGPFLGPWIQSHRKQVLSHHGKHKTPKNISQALIEGENTGCSMPWFALIETDFNICGGALVSSRYVLSAHGCLYDSMDEVVKMEVVLGAYSDDQTSERENFEFTNGDVVTHDEYDYDLDFYDIALIELFEEVTFNDFIAPIRIWTEDRDWTGTAATFAGMGGIWEGTNLIMPTGLQDLTQEIQTEEFCISKLDEFYNHDMHICTSTEGSEGRAADFGDDGGPLFIYDDNEEPWLIGLVSYQPMEDFTAGFPTKHIRLSHYLCWLDDMSDGELDLPDNLVCTGGGGESACDLKRTLALKNLKVQAMKMQKVQKKHKAKKSKKSHKKKNQKKSQRGVKPTKGKKAGPK